MFFLGLETSCDECSASVVSTEPPAADSPPQVRVLSLKTHSQIPIHAPYGGVVPEIASRNHLENINPMIDAALLSSGVPLSDLSAISVTNRPGLIGALLVGVAAAKALAYVTGRPLVGVHHLEAHAVGPFLDADPKSMGQLRCPAILAIISGGHSNLYLMKNFPQVWPDDFLKSSLIGQSRDDAAGEAFDKIGRILGLPYPGGPAIEKTARSGDPSKFQLPRALAAKATYDFSFSGLKTAAYLLCEKLKKEGTLEKNQSDLAASVQEAIVDALIRKIILAARDHQCQSIIVVGGVAANQRLRTRLSADWTGSLIFPSSDYCTDNAAMVAAAGAFRFFRGDSLCGEELLRLGAKAGAES